MARTVLCNETEKNIIPVLLAGASFPKQLPDDINEVRNFQAPTCVHEYFDSFYSKLKDFLHAYPRSAPYSSPSTLSPNLPKLKLKADLDCVFYLDGKETARLISGELSLIPLSEGEYELKFVSEENAEDIVTEDYFEIPNRDKRYDVKLLPICEKRLGYRTVDDGLVFNAKGVEFKMVHVEGDIFMMGAQKPIQKPRIMMKKLLKMKALCIVLR